MSVRLIRESSDTPNITNKDDARMIRYAYGGQNGYVQGSGAELSSTVNGNVFTINSGVINLQGWEVEIDSNGWSTTLSIADAAKKYCAVYVEVNLSLGGSSKIDMMTSTEGYPDVPEGDDLTKNTSGTARLVLYHFIAQSGNISEIKKVVNVMLYAGAISNRPPVSSVSFINGAVATPSSVSHSLRNGEAVYFFGIGVSGSEVAAPIYLPNDSGNAISKIEFVQSNSDFFEYRVDSNQSSRTTFACYAKKDCRVSGYDYSGASNYKHYAIDVTAKITDLYGNEHEINWVVKFINLDERVQ